VPNFNFLENQLFLFILMIFLISFRILRVLYQAISKTKSPYFVIRLGFRGFVKISAFFGKFWEKMIFSKLLLSLELVLNSDFRAKFRTKFPIFGKKLIEQ